MNIGRFGLILIGFVVLQLMIYLMFKIVETSPSQ